MILYDFVTLRYVEEHMRGQNWTVARHSQFPTTDIPVKDIPALQELAHEVLQTEISPAICALYRLAPNCLVAHDLFIVKYSAEEEGGQRALALHQVAVRFISLFNWIQSIENDACAFAGRISLQFQLATLRSKGLRWRRYILCAHAGSGAGTKG